MSLVHICVLLCVLGASSGGMVDYLTGYDELSSKVDGIHESAQKHIDALYKRIEALEEKMENLKSGMYCISSLRFISNTAVVPVTQQLYQ